MRNRRSTEDPERDDIMIEKKDQVKSLPLRIIGLTGDIEVDLRTDQVG
jgi:hypothetical protein